LFRDELIVLHNGVAAGVVNDIGEAWTRQALFEFDRQHLQVSKGGVFIIAPGL
jgi:hypothetical protein